MFNCGIKKKNKMFLWFGLLNFFLIIKKKILGVMIFFYDYVVNLVLFLIDYMFFFILKWEYEKDFVFF